VAQAIVIGAGPAGLMAAQELATAGHSVTLADAMPSFGRKFLMAGKSGLNLTKDEAQAPFVANFGPIAGAMQTALDSFGPKEVIAFAQELGQEVFTGSTGRVFPVVMKASPLLRAWLGRLSALGVEMKPRWRWDGWDGDTLLFDTPDGSIRFDAEVTVLALGGASWARLGSNGRWAEFLSDAVSAFAPANMGLVVEWSDHMVKHFGAPVKGVALSAGDQSSRGEFTVSKRGIEGGGIYAVSRAVREGAPLVVDLLPDLEMGVLRDRLARRRPKESLGSFLRKSLKLDPVKVAILNEFARPLPNDLAPVLKGLEVRHSGPRPMDEAISTAGGVSFDQLDAGLMLSARPGVFCAGEMLDWEAPTGGYLLTGCLATGRHAGRAAADYAASL